MIMIMISDRNPLRFSLSIIGWNNRSMIHPNRLRAISAQQHLLAIPAAELVMFQTFPGTVFGDKLSLNTSSLLFISIIIDAEF